MGYIGQQITTVFPTSVNFQLTDSNMSAGSVIQVVLGCL
jgi:hypothetical protein